MIIEIKGVQFVNKGAELMLYSILHKVNELWPDAELVLEPKSPSPYIKRVEHNCYQKLNLRKKGFDLNFISYYFPKKFRSYLKNRWGVITESDVDFIIDASGFAYGDQWSSISIKYLCNEIERFDKNHKKYIFMPQAFGPFTRANDIKRLKNTLHKAKIIYARETSSYNYLKTIGVNTINLKIKPDFTNILNGIKPENDTFFNDKVIIIPNSKMISDKNNNSEWSDTYIRILLDIISSVKKLSLIPVILNHEGLDDEILCKKLIESDNFDIEYITESNPLKVKGIIGSSKAVVCSRFHGCVSALSQGIPCLGTSWSHKYERLFSEYGRINNLIQPNKNTSEIELLLISMLNEEKNSEVVEMHKNSSYEMWSEVYRLVGNGKN